MSEKKIWSFFKGAGMNDYGVAGLMGNLYAESGLSPTNLQNSYNKKLKMTDEQYTKAVDNGSYKNFIKDSAGYGLAQWTYWSRKQNLLTYAQKTEKSIGDLDMQLNFLLQELKSSYKSVYATLCNATSVLEASNAVLLKFERPADQSVKVQSKRASYGQQYYDKHAVVAQPVVKPAPAPDFTSMKYSTSNPPLKCIMKNSTNYKSTGKMAIKGILWHSTGANNPTLRRYVQPYETDDNYNELIAVLGKNNNGNDWNHIYRKAGVNAWIGKLADGTISTVQTLPWDQKPWGCGSGKYGSCNNGWIQFEICEDSLSNKTYFNQVYKEAVELTAYLCKLYNINPLGTVSYKGRTLPTILCHQDSYQLGFGGNHSDVLHWFKLFGKTMDDVRNDVAALLNTVVVEEEDEEEMTQEKFNEMMNVYLSQLAAKEPSVWSEEARTWCESNGIINGDETGNKMYKKFLTREEMAAIAYRLFGKK